MNLGIIGGGASGLMASILAARQGIDVSLFERKDRVGKKLLATGNGRCNVTNRDLCPGHYHSREEGFSQPILDRYPLEATKRLFESLGMDLVEEDRGKLYPVSLQAAGLLNVLRKEMARLGVEEKTQTMIKKINSQAGKFQLMDQDQKTYQVDQVILATGGRSMPSSGSDGAGYGLYQALGHRLTKTFPAIAGLKLDSAYLKQVQGTKVQGEIGLFWGEKLVQRTKGEILFTREGLSGPPVLDLARKVNDLGEDLFVEMPLINHLDQLGPDYKDRLMDRVYSHQDWEVYDFLQAILAKPLIQAVIKKAGLSQDQKLYLLDYKDLQGLFEILFSNRMKVIGTRDYDQAQVTCGGLDVRDFFPQTLESKLWPGLYATGEVLDVDGDCGGYNLQWAWASAQAVVDDLVRKL